MYRIYLEMQSLEGIKHIQLKLQMMEMGDFQFEFEEKLTSRKDEVGIIARSTRICNENCSNNSGHSNGIRERKSNFTKFIITNG